ncbi:hypothetical protein LguiB_020300 [Lonicera macranthoides]
MAGGADPSARQLDQTPTWAVALVCAVIVLISILLEEVLHTIGENYISAICIPAKYADTMLPCPLKKKLHKEPAGHLPAPKGEDAEHHRRLLLWDDRRFLAADSQAKGCKHRHNNDAGEIKGWQAMFWISIMPLVVTLAVGTKLQAIITRMAVEIQEKHAVVQGIPLVQVSDRYFWFSKPRLVLYLIHLTLFQYEFGLHSCFNENFRLQLVRVALGVGVQFLCSYITLPLYSLVTQMGSTMKKSIFDEQTSKALMSWHKNAKKKHDGSSHASPHGHGKNGAGH